MQIRRVGEITGEILRLVAIGALITIALSSPSGTRKITKLLWKETGDVLSSYRRRRLIELEKAGYIQTQGGEVRLTKLGQGLLAKAELDEVSIEKHPWDHVWRCVVYDIPNSLTAQRRAFHSLLLRWGFTQVQKSVLVIPYRCQEQVAVAARVYGVQKYILLMEANDIPTATRLKQRFNL